MQAWLPSASLLRTYKGSLALVIKASRCKASELAPVRAERIDFIQPFVSCFPAAHFMQMDLSAVSGQAEVGLSYWGRERWEGRWSWPFPPF